MYNKPKVSIIVPVYNVEEYFEECIQSIISQTYTNIEIILVDDGSTDGSGRMCDEYARKDERIRVIHKENGGQASARNMGLDVATGDYIQFVDSDDYIASTMVEDLVNALIDNCADISICGCISFYYEGEKRIDKTYNVYDIAAVVTGKQILSEVTTEMGYMLDVPRGIVCNKCFPSYYFENIRFPVGQVMEDAYIVHRLLGKAKKAATISKGLYYYRQRANSTMNRSTEAWQKKRAFDMHLVMCDRAEYYKEIGLTDIAFHMYNAALFGLINEYKNYKREQLTKNRLPSLVKRCRTLLEQYKRQYPHEKRNILSVSLFLFSPFLYSISLGWLRKCITKTN